MDLVFYQTKLTKKQDEILKDVGMMLKEKGVIKENNKYNVTRFAFITLVSFFDQDKLKEYIEGGIDNGR